MHLEFLERRVLTNEERQELDDALAEEEADHDAENEPEASEPGE